MNEVVVELKEIPNTNWSICLTSRNHEFFYCHDDMSKNTWNVPEEIMDIVGELLNDGLDFDDDDGVDEDEDVDQDDVDVEENVHELQKLEHDDEITSSNGKKRSLDTFTVQDSDSASMNPTHEPAPKKAKSKSFQELEQDFNSLLEERKVSPFSTWIVEREKLQLDERASALDPIDQKDLFEKWLIRAAEKALEEKKAIDAMGPRAKYSLLLQEAITDKNWKSARFADFSRRFKNDVRFLQFTPSSSSKEKETMFEEHIKTLKLASRDTARKEFDEMLTEMIGDGDIDPDSNSSLALVHVVQKVQHDARYQAVKNAVERENRIKTYLNALKKR